MNEIEKLYELAGIGRIEGPEWVCENPDHCTYQNLSIVPENCSGCEYFEIEMVYPPFTAEKQLELIKWISKKEGFRVDGFSIEFGIYATGYSSDFEIALAKSINCFLEYCSSKEKEQIKEILENRRTAKISGG